MKLEQYTKAQSGQGIREQTHEFFEYHQNYIQQVGNTYWKETDSSVSSKMSLSSQPRSRMISFVSNDYLGLSQHMQVQSDAIRAINLYGTGFCAAPSIGGYSSLQKRLEVSLSLFLHTEDTIIFNSGFSANVGMMSALAQKDDVVFLDKGVHRSVFEGVKHCICKVLPHNDLNALEKALQRYKADGRNLFVIIDGVYSQDGDLGLVQEYLDVSEKYNAMLIVDDSHGIGVLGETGAGLLEVKGILGKVPLVTGSLSKAFGTIGGYVSGRKELIDYIRYYAGSCCFSVSLPPPYLAAALKSLELIQKYAEERKELLAKAEYARKKLQEAGIPITNSSSPIIGILSPTYDDAILWAERLLERNIYIIPIGYPAVSKLHPRLRLALSHLHSYRDIDQFIAKLTQVSKPDYQYMAKQRRSSAEISKLIDQATQEIIREKGFSGLSVQEVCTRAAIDPTMFYHRYPEGFVFYIEKFIREHDFWFDFYNTHSLDNLLGTPKELTNILMSLWSSLCNDGLLKASLRIALQDSPSEASIEIAKERDNQALPLVELFSSSSSNPQRKKIQLAILTAGIQYLALHKDISPFCGIDFNDLPIEELREALQVVIDELDQR